MAHHPLRQILENAARGEFPAPAGSLAVFPTLGSAPAVVALTAAHYIVTDVAEAEIRRRLDPADIGAAMRPPFLAWLANETATRCGLVDMVLARNGLGGGARRLREVGSHGSGRVARSYRYRQRVQILSEPDHRAVVTIGAGLVDRTEMSIEVASEHRFRGAGREAILDALRQIEPTDSVFAQVSPGNAASVRAFLAAGFLPIGSEVLFSPLSHPAALSGD